MPRRIRLAALALAPLLATSVSPRPAEACGGLFCDTIAPVIQTGEQIVFSVDRARGTVDAIINIRYAGPAADFAWVLPLQSAPVTLQVGAQSTFQTVDQLTSPRFVLRSETQGRCRATNDSAFEEDASLATSLPPQSERGVEVVFRKEVGPYDAVVLEGSDPELVRTWLSSNGYQVTDAMMRQVVPYVQKGDALLALKLRKDNDVGDIQPVHVTMLGDEVCVPIRLTAIAAVDDMDITVLVLSDEGRAVPENYFEVELNWARIDWLRGATNYRELVALAADEGDGNAFTTEFAGSARIFDGQLYPAAGYRRPPLEAASSFARLLDALVDQRLHVKAGLGPILRRHAQGSLRAELETAAGRFDACPTCFSGLDGAIDVAAAVDEVWTRIVEPERRAQALFDARAHATRLYTLLSPEEMTVDPEFVFRPSLPDVSNVHVATLVTECAFAGGVLRQYVRLEDGGQTFDVDADLSNLPASARVRQLAEGVEVRDNRSLIDRRLDRVNGGCTCAAGPRPSALAVLASGLVGLLVFARRARRPDARTAG